jgi:hypothetical protein
VQESRAVEAMPRDPDPAREIDVTVLDRPADDPPASSDAGAPSLERGSIPRPGLANANLTLAR